MPGRAFGKLATIVLCLDLISLAGSFSRHGFAWGAFAGANGGSLHMEAERDGARHRLYVKLWGEVSSGDDHRFQDLIKPYLATGDSLYRVTISSVGGDADAAMGIGRQIRTLDGRVRAPIRLHPNEKAHCLFKSGRDENPVPTADSELNDPDGYACMCVSACSLIWAAGVRREGNAIGIHRFRLTRESELRANPELLRAVTEQGERQFRGYLAEMGMPPFFIEKTLSTPAATVYQLTLEEAERETANWRR